jgi:hypothetical protein
VTWLKHGYNDEVEDFFLLLRNQGRLVIFKSKHFTSLNRTRYPLKTTLAIINSITYRYVTIKLTIVEATLDLYSDIIIIMRMKNIIEINHCFGMTIE